MIEAGWLTLRPWTRHDLSFVFVTCQDPEIQRWTTVPVPYRAADAVAFLEAGYAARQAGTGEWLAIEATDTSELLGAIALKDVAGGTGEIGYWVAPECRGRGVAATAVAALAEWAFTQLGLAEVWLQVAEGNEASIRAARRAGFEPGGVRPGGCPVGGVVRDALVFRRRAPGR